MKKLIIVITSLLIMVEHIVVGQGVVVVSDPGQAQGGLITTEDIVPFIHIDLTASNTTSDQTVYLTIEQNGAIADADVFTGSFSNKLTGMQVVLGPFVVQSGQTTDIVVSARVNSVNATTNSSPTVDFNLMSVSNSTPGAIQGALPIQGTAYTVDTNSEEVIQGKFTSIYVLWQYDEAPLDTNGIPLDLLWLDVKADSARLYEVQYSEDMVSWQPISELFSGINDLLQPGNDGTFTVACFMRLPPQCYYRLKSSP